MGKILISFLSRGTRNYSSAHKEKKNRRQKEEKEASKKILPPRVTDAGEKSFLLREGGGRKRKNLSTALYCLRKGEADPLTKREYL